MSFTKRLLTAQFTLGQGVFGQDGQNQLNLSNLRMSVRIDRAGGMAMAQLSLDVWGMRLSDMNTLSTLGLVATTLRKNTVLVQAGDEGGMTTVFSGTIFDAYVDLSCQPDVRFHVNASSGLLDAVAPATPSSWKGAVNVTTILSTLAKKMTSPMTGKVGVPFENNGVSVVLHDQYLHGSLRDQALQAVENAGIYWNGLEDGTLAIWPPGKSRNGSVPLVSATTGLQSYPAYQSLGISFTTLFNPAIRFGGQVNVQSSQLLIKQNVIAKDGNITSAVNTSGSGIWVINMLNHRLETLLPHGDWFSDAQASPVGYIVAPSP
jgi:hypothetical protein